MSTDHRQNCVYNLQLGKGICYSLYMHTSCYMYIYLHIYMALLWMLDECVYAPRLFFLVRACVLACVRACVRVCVV